MTTAKTPVPSDGSSQWIVPAAQKRSTRTLARILETATELLNERAFDEVTVADICRAASCSPPSFYQRFKDKEALLHALHEKYTEDTIAALDLFFDHDAWPGRTIDVLVHDLIVGIIALESQTGGLRVTAVRRSLADDRFAARFRRIRGELYRRLGASLRLLLPPDAPRDPDHAARFLVRLIQGVAVRQLEGPRLESEPFDQEELIDDLCHVCLTYLRTLPAGAGR